jgi:hypothetical protein
LAVIEARASSHFQWAFQATIVHYRRIPEMRATTVHMARKRTVIEEITCDLCGKVTDDATTVTLGWGRDQWSLDLCDKDNADVSKVFDSWIEQGTKVTGRSGGARGRHAGGGTGENDAMRTWARSNGFTVGTKGRISQEIRDAYAGRGKG